MAGAGKRDTSFGRPDFAGAGIADGAAGRITGAHSFDASDEGLDGAVVAERLPRRDTIPPVVGR